MVQSERLDARDLTAHRLQPDPCAVILGPSGQPKHPVFFQSDDGRTHAQSTKTECPGAACQPREHARVFAGFACAAAGYAAGCAAGYDGRVCSDLHIAGDPEIAAARVKHGKGQPAWVGRDMRREPRATDDGNLLYH